MLVIHKHFHLYKHNAFPIQQGISDMFDITNIIMHVYMQCRSVVIKGYIVNIQNAGLIMGNLRENIF